MNISRMLVANRGEIAVRIIRTCRVLGIETVLVVSEADRDSIGSRLADRSIVIGPPNVSTYLNISSLIKAAKATGADALHPGYGFLSEKQELAKACSDNGIIFIGPRADHIEKMGNKLIARKLATGIGVPVLPGSDKVSSYQEVLDVVGKIGYPIMIKAAAGGGGRGMKIVTETDSGNLKQLFESASLEALTAFGDGTLYAEKYIPNARHIEVQILGDKYGNVIHLGERDCSTQRRHQKLIEEAGAPNISEELRNRICGAAVMLAKSIAYENAGTVEFILNQDTGDFYFLEVNTRLQVEHPVTEMVTGVDIVSEQIIVADGMPLHLAQDSIRKNGHAIECRINAENPTEDFKPTPGQITKWEMPQGPGIRVDTHCHSGYKIPVYYDSLIAKVIAHGDDREHARRRMIAALQEFVIGGIFTTVPFLIKVLNSPEFIDERVSTRILEKIRM